MSAKLSVAQPLSLSKVKENLRTRVVGHPLVYFRELTSTNQMAKLFAENGLREGTVVIAERQTEGRGRLDREWVSPPEGLWFSTVLRPRVHARHLPKLTLLASVAVAKTVRRLYGLMAEIKWPNDVLVNGKKVCGILTEAETKGESTEFAVVGIGVNANFDLSALPKSLESSSTTLKHELKREIRREVLLSSLLEEMESVYELFSRERFDQILDEWRNLAGMLGASVEIKVDEEDVQGQAVDIDQDGALILRLEDGVTRTVAFGDLTVLKPAISKQGSTRSYCIEFLSPNPNPTERI